MAKSFQGGGLARQPVLAESDGVSRFLGVRFVLVIALLTAAAVRVSGASENATEQAFQSFLVGTNLHPRAFVEDHSIRIYFTNDARIWMLKATWKLSRMTAEKFIYASTTIQSGKSPNTLPDANSSWREVTVLSRAESDRLLKKVADRIVPAEPSHGIFCRFALGDATMYRDAGGQVQIASRTNKPANVTIDRRYTRQGFASVVTGELETALRAAHPGRTRFLLAIGRGSGLRLAFLDLPQKEAVVLYVPRKGDNQRGTARIGNRIVKLSSFILIDNVSAFLKNPVTTSVRIVNQCIQWPRTLLPRLTHPQSEIPPVASAPGMDLVAWEQWLDHHADAPREQGSLRLLIDGDNFYPTFKRLSLPTFFVVFH